MIMKLQSIVFALAAIVLFASSTLAQEQSGQNDNPVLEKIITPDLERRTISEDQLDSEDWEIGVYGGLFSVEDFGTSSVVGIRVAYHMTEDFVIELNYGETEAEEAEIGGIPLLTDDQREYTYYNVSIVYNIFPGEVFIGRKTAFNSSFYILAGAGNTTFDEDDSFTVTVGGGLRFYLTDSIALHATVKDHIFDDEEIRDKVTNNIETTLGVSLYF